MDYAGFLHPKPEPRCVLKLRAKKWDTKNERACREITRKRDGGKCRIPGCKEHATELHHIVARAHSKKRRWDTRNVCWLCRSHHQLRHAGIISIGGDADRELIVTGDIDRLRFRLCDRVLLPGAGCRLRGASRMNDKPSLQYLDTELTRCRLIVNDFVSCATETELNRWRLAQLALIDAAKAVGRVEAAIEKRQRYLKRGGRKSNAD